MSQTKKRKRVEKRSRQANWQAQRRAEGRCPNCGGPRDFNVHRGKPYSRCRNCRRAFNAAMARLMRRRRAQDD